MESTARLERMDFSKRIEARIVGAFADNSVAEKVFERLRLLAVASTAIAAAETIERDCFQSETHCFATVYLAVVEDKPVVGFEPSAL